MHLAPFPSFLCRSWRVAGVTIRHTKTRTQVALNGPHIEACFKVSLEIRIYNQVKYRKNKPAYFHRHIGGMEKKEVRGAKEEKARLGK